MPGGQLILSYEDGSSLEIGTVTTIQESLQKSCTVVPLVSMSMTDTFAVDMKSQKVINIQFMRNQPSSGLTNGEWVSAMLSALNRWQCETDGFSLRYIADDDNPYIAEINENGYVKSFSYQISAGQNTVVKGSLEFHVGTMYVTTAPKHERIYTSQFSLRMTDSNGIMPYSLISSEDSLNCVESYTLCGGPESPFEYLSVVIPRNRLSSVAPALTEEDGIVAGRNTIELDAIGRSDMTVTKCKLSNNKYTITAYCNADRLRGCTLSEEENDTPEGIIRHILSDVEGRYGVSFTEDAGSLIMHYTPSNIGNLVFPIGKNVWYVLQVCAMCLGCRIFFANNCAYVVDMRLEGGSDMIETRGVLNLFSEDSNAIPTVNTPSLGDEGIDTIINSIQIRATKSARDEESNPTTDTEIGTVTCEDESSIELYYTKSGGILSLEELKELEPIIEPPPEGEEGEGTVIQEALPQASTFGYNYISYRCEPQQSIEFTVKEMHKDNAGPYWASEFLPAARASRIDDPVDDVIITNMSDISGEPMLQKLCLSTFERHYPQGTTTYTWGVMASIDLSSSTSQITTSISNIS